MLETSPVANSPLVIWTLQRTGGTNLTSYLNQHAGLQTVPHEPFNGGRVWGEITERWVQGRDRAALDSAVRAVCSTPSVIKHCVEVVPQEISHSLACATVAAGYRHFFLYRKDPLDRLLSLHFARQTGIWGPGKAARNYNAEAEFAELPIDKLVDHEQHCVRSLSTAWQQLKSLGVKPYAMAFEDLYEARSPALAALQMENLFKYLDWQNTDSPEKMAEEVSSKGDQGTRSKYHAFPGREDLRAALASVPRFTPN